MFQKGAMPVAGHCVIGNKESRSVLFFQSHVFPAKYGTTRIRTATVVNDLYYHSAFTAGKGGLLAGFLFFLWFFDHRFYPVAH